MEIESTVKGHEMKVNGITPSPNGQLVLSISTDGKLHIRKSNDMVSVVQIGEILFIRLGGQLV